MREIVILAGTRGESLAREVCTLLSVRLGEAIVGRFKDGEVRVEIVDNVRDKDVFIIAPTSPPAENLLELVLLAEAAASSSAGRVTAIPTYLGYNRQDRKMQSRTPISARLPITLLNKSGAGRVLLLDLHSEATIIAFDEHIKVDHLYGSQVSLPHLRPLLGGKSKVASPDKGGTARARAYQRLLGLGDYVIFDKFRPVPNETHEEVRIVGDVKGYNLIFPDDIVDTGGTLIADAIAAKQAGAADLYAFCTHALLSDNAAARLQQSPFKRIFVTNSIQQDWVALKKTCPKLTMISAAPLIAEAIQRIHSGQSLSPLIPKSGAGR